MLGFFCESAIRGVCYCAIFGLALENDNHREYVVIIQTRMHVHRIGYINNLYAFFTI